MDANVTGTKRKQKHCLLNQDLNLEIMINWAPTDTRFNAETDRVPGPGLNKCRLELYWL